MALVKLKPTSPGRRGTVRVVNHMICTKVMAISRYWSQSVRQTDEIM